MRVRLTYLHHNSFVLGCENRALLFDWPAPEHQPEGALGAVRAAIGGRELTVFASHGHADHFDPNTHRLAESAADAGFIYSDDIGELYPESVPSGALLVEPDENYGLRGLRIRTFLSNDLGVAFLVAVPTLKGDLLVWHGGDFARWDWPESSEAEQRFNRKYFEDTLARVRHEIEALSPGGRLHVAFQNCDPRLPGQAGGARFLEALRPRVFAPMHAFGDLDFVRGLEPELDACRDADARLFLYDRCGTAADIVFSSL